MYHILLITDDHGLNEIVQETGDCTEGFAFLLDTLPLYAAFSAFPGMQPDGVILDRTCLRETDCDTQAVCLSLLHMKYSSALHGMIDGSHKQQRETIQQCRDLIAQLMASPCSCASPAALTEAAACLHALTSMNRLIHDRSFQLPDYSKYSFSAGLSLMPDDRSTGRRSDPFSELSPLSACSDLHFMLYYHTENRYLLLVLYELTGEYTRLEQHRRHISRVLKSASGRPLFQFGMLHHSLSGLVSSCLEACQTSYVDRFQSPGTFFEEISSPAGDPLKPPHLMEIERSIRTDIQFREGKNALSYVKQWFAECAANSYTLRDIKYDLIILYSSIKYTLFDMYTLKLKRIKAGMEVHEILNVPTAGELEQWFCAWLIYTLDNFDLTRSHSGFRIQEVLQFISNHIMDDLSLHTIASYFYVNASYFSTVFKKETGQTYISYVTQVKMEKAMELLKSKCRVYEAAHLLGYEDVRHFRNTFRKHFNISPSEVKPDEW